MSRRCCNNNCCRNNCCCGCNNWGGGCGGGFGGGFGCGFPLIWLLLLGGCW
ncbi:hypothetical protein [Clostridium sartagoforme]|uniref:hypothetical protein n=1 Tax=Clostridium sartagoforme TaxID=84031 RepID=UPI0014429F04|nr:hypothetical protein [Clostridium sartagoforme]